MSWVRDKRLYFCEKVLLKINEWAPLMLCDSVYDYYINKIVILKNCIFAPDDHLVLRNWLIEKDVTLYFTSLRGEVYDFDRCYFSFADLNLRIFKKYQTRVYFSIADKSAINSFMVCYFHGYGAG
jgi:hypothetical protein